jgi:hypothetical protein
MADVIDLLKFADESRPVDFADAFNQLMGQKVVDILDVAKQSIASSVFNNNVDEVETSDVDNGETYEDS